MSSAVMNKYTPIKELHDISKVAGSMYDAVISRHRPHKRSASLFRIVCSNAVGGLISESATRRDAVKPWICEVLLPRAILGTHHTADGTEYTNK